MKAIACILGAIFMLINTLAVAETCKELDTRSVGAWLILLLTCVIDGITTLALVALTFKFVNISFQ